jgi:hypothetical protein
MKIKELFDLDGLAEADGIFRSAEVAAILERTGLKPLYGPENVQGDASGLAWRFPDWFGGGIGVEADAAASAARPPIAPSGVSLGLPAFGLRHRAWFSGDGDVIMLGPHEARSLLTGLRVTAKPENVEWAFVPWPSPGVAVTLAGDLFGHHAASIPGVPGNVAYRVNSLGLCLIGEAGGTVLRCGIANFGACGPFGIRFGQTLGWLVCAPAGVCAQAAGYFATYSAFRSGAWDPGLSGCVWLDDGQAEEGMP